MYNILKYTCFLVIAALIGLIGGVLATPFLTYFNRPVPLPPSDAISVANTYIVFTTFIFAGFTVVLAILGVVFAQQFSTVKELQLRHLKEELLSQIKENHCDIGINFINEALENKDIRNHFENKMDMKIIQILREKYEIDGDIEIRSIKDSIGGEK
jgi:hypothetical protein